MLFTVLPPMMRVWAIPLEWIGFDEPGPFRAQLAVIDTRQGVPRPALTGILNDFVADQLGGPV
jgi:hypothetical protein